MKQGETKRTAPKDKHTKPSWIKRDKGRKVDQEVYAANLLLAARDADDAPHTPIIPDSAESALNLADILDRKERNGR